MLSLGFKPQLDRLLEALVLKRPPVTATAPVSSPAPQVLLESLDASGSASRSPDLSSSSPQVLLFTATMPPEVDEAASRWLKTPVKVKVTHSAASISRTITQARRPLPHV